MKSFKSLALVFAAAVISLGSFAQASTTTPAKPAAKSTAAKPATKPATKTPAVKGATKSSAAKKTDASAK